MKVNLTEFSKEKDILKYAQKVLSQTSVSQTLSRKLSKIIKKYEEIEVDLELSGECIISLDQERLEAIEERNKALAFIKDEDYE